MGDGYAVVELDDAPWSTVADGVSHGSLTERLGTTETTVDAYRLTPGSTVDLAGEPEQLVVPLDADAPLVVSESVVVPAGGLGRVPAGVEPELRSRAEASVVVVGAAATADPDADPIALGRDDWTFDIPSSSDVATAFLTAPLGCTGMKANVRRLDPGQVVPYHTEGVQEELFVPVDGPGSMHIADDRYGTPPGTVTRVAPDIPRSACNAGDATAHWVMVGAPPTGGPTDWDPGSEILE